MAENEADMLERPGWTMRLVWRKRGDDVGCTTGIRAAFGEALLSSLRGHARIARSPTLRRLLCVNPANHRADQARGGPRRRAFPMLERT